MSTLNYTREALADLSDIQDYLLQHSPAAARVMQEIERSCRLLSQFPLMGAARDTLQPGLRSHPSGRYTIYYRPSNGGIDVLRVLHGSRDVTGLFSP